MTNDSIKNRLIAILKDTALGLNIAQIEKQMPESRNTVKKYLHQLESESIISMKQMGQAYVYYLNENKPRLDIDKRLIIAIMNTAIGATAKVTPKYISNSNEYIREVWRDVGGTLGPFLFSFTGKLKKEIGEINNKTEALNKIAEISLDFFHNIINELIGDIVHGEIIPSASQAENSSITFRFEVISNEINATEHFFHSATGFYEGLLLRRFGRFVKKKFNEKIHIEILKIDEEKKVGYFTLEIR